MFGISHCLLESLRQGAEIVKEGCGALACELPWWQQLEAGACLGLGPLKVIKPKVVGWGRANVKPLSC